jgi:hypothetical protein
MAELEGTTRIIPGQAVQIGFLRFDRRLRFWRFSSFTKTSFGTASALGNAQSRRPSAFCPPVPESDISSALFVLLIATQGESSLPSRVSLLWPDLD